MKKILLKIILRILNCKIFYLLSDSIYLRIRYFCILGKKLNIKNPKTFNEKLQWLKINDRNSLYTNMVDKYEVKNFVKNKIGEEYIIPTIGIYDSFDDINFDKLPEKFVIKCTHDSGGICICRDKQSFDKKRARKKINKTFRKNFFYSGREWPYKNVKPRIIIEKYMSNGDEKELTDYKFFCFNGEPRYVYVSTGLENHETARMSFLDTNYEKMEFYRKDYKPFDELPKKPKEFKKMLEIAEIFAKDIPFIRVDLYEINEKIYFSELTFSPCSGFIPFEPEEWDEKIGELLDLPN